MDEYSFMNQGSLTRLVVNLFQPKRTGVILSIGRIVRELDSERIRKGIWSPGVGFNLDQIKTAVKGLSERNVLYEPSTAKGGYVVNNKDLWRTDKQYQEYLKLVESSSFMNEGTLTRSIVDLFQPKSDGTTLSVGSIAKRLGIKIPKRRSWTPKDKEESTLYGLRKAIEELSGGRNVLYTRLALPGVYAIKCERLWKNDEQYRDWRDSRLSKMFF